jgi:hypothetical protein
MRDVVSREYVIERPQVDDLRAFSFDRLVRFVSVEYHRRVTSFTKLNEGWNAEPNAPHPGVRVDGKDVVLSFWMNPWQFPQYDEDDIGMLRFRHCSRYRLGPTYDEGWYLGQCRFSGMAPTWGEFYEVTGDLRLSKSPADWMELSAPNVHSRHFLFYLRDQTFECDAEGWDLVVGRQPRAHPRVAR